jgi:hypothetical protein
MRMDQNNGHGKGRTRWPSADHHDKSRAVGNSTLRRLVSCVSQSDEDAQIEVSRETSTGFHVKHRQVSSQYADWHRRRRRGASTINSGRRCGPRRPSASARDTTPPFLRRVRQAHLLQRPIGAEPYLRVLYVARSDKYSAILSATITRGALWKHSKREVIPGVSTHDL